MENNFYVYEWIRLDTNEPFYVGKGSGNRWKLLTRGDNNHFNNIVKSIPVAVNILHDNLDEQAAFGLEVWYIREYRDIIGYESMCNINDGGEGNIMSKEARKRTSERMKGENNPMKRPEVKARMIENNPTKSGEKHPRATSVICLTTGRIFSTIKEGAKCYNCFASSISLCLSGNNKSAGKLEDDTPLVWMYLKDYKNSTNEEIQQRIQDAINSNDKIGENNPMWGKKRPEISGKNNYHAMPVICITTNKIFNTVTDGAKYYKCHQGEISNCCRGWRMIKGKKYNVKSAGKLPDGTKLVWKYLNYKHDKRLRPLNK